MRGKDGVALGRIVITKGEHVVMLQALGCQRARKRDGEGHCCSCSPREENRLIREEGPVAANQMVLETWDAWRLLLICALTPKRRASDTTENPHVHLGANQLIDNLLF